MNSRDEVVIGLARSFKEYLDLSGLVWDSGYFRFVRKGVRAWTVEWAHLVGRNHFQATVFDSAPLKVDGALNERYFGMLEKQFCSLYDLLEADGVGAPAVAVLKVTKEGSYKIDFDYKNPRALQIANIYLGLGESYFKPGEIDIPGYVLDFQNELDKVRADEAG